MAIRGGATCRLAAAVCLLLLNLLLAALQLQGAGAAEPLVPAMFVFGDSMVDVGNNNFIDSCDHGCKANYPRYGVDYLDHAPTGRFSNGYNLADHLAKLLGFAESPPPFLSLTNASSHMSTGINFASGGSGLQQITGNREQSCKQVLSIAEQVGNFTNLARSWASADNRSAADVLSKSLFFISAGSNDLFEYMDIGPQTNATEFLQSLLVPYAAYLRDLYGVGARKFSVMGTSLLGCCPSQRLLAFQHQAPTDKYGCLAALNSLSIQLTPMFDAMLQDLSRELPGMNYSFARATNMSESVLDNPNNALGNNFTVLDTACCGKGKFGAFEPGCNFSADLCPDRSTYLFWDDYHPTETLAQLAANFTFTDPTGVFVHPINVKELVGAGAPET